jgi:hypothetical protein
MTSLLEIVGLHRHGTAADLTGRGRRRFNAYGVSAAGFDNRPPA